MASAPALPTLPTLLALLVLLSACAPACADGAVCALVPEGAPAALACPPGQVITAVTSATFGTFSAASSCAAGLAPLPACPAPVLAQVSRLCTGAAACNVSCDCASLPSPCGCASAAPAALSGELLRLALPGVPCSGVRKQLGIVAACGAPLPPPAPQPAPPAPAPAGLLLEYLPSPVLGVDTLLPHFAWTPPAAAARGAVQTASRVVVTTYPAGAPVWDSGAVPGGAPQQLPPAPLPLAADARYQWTVATADGSGAWSPASQPARFSTGLLAPSDWGGAEWIGGWRAGTLLRRDFNVTAPADYASIFVSACQYYLLYIDGVRVGARELDVAWTRFQYFRSYASYELPAAGLLAPGRHTLGLALGQGFCGQSGGAAGNHTPQGLLRLALHAADGALAAAPVVTEAASGAWRSGSGPVLSDSTYFGENYDAAREQPGWAAPGFVPPPGAPAWAPAAATADPEVPPLMTSQLMPAIERVAALRALSVTPVAAPGLQRWTYDFGTQVAGRSLLAVPPGLPRGTNFTLRHAEVLSHPPFADYDGSAWMGNLFWAYPVDSYLTAGAAAGGGESFEPAFTQHEFRFVEVSIDPPLPGPPALDMVTAVVLRTAAAPQAELRLGSPLLQALSAASVATEAVALMGIPAGTGARGERTAWTGDAAAAAESELVDYDTGAFFVQFLQQLQQLQCADGTVPSCIPNTDPHRDGQPKPLPCAGAEGDPSWGTVYPTVAHGVWKYYGALGVARRHYPSLLAYMDMLERAVNGTGLKDIFCEWGDWNPAVERTDCHVTAAASYLHDLLRLQELAGALGQAADAASFAARLATRRAEFHAAFWNASLALYGGGTQTAQAVALWTGVAGGAGVAASVAAWLGSSLVGSGLKFGFLGVRYVYEALALSGGIEAALRALLRVDFPSFGFALYHEYEPTSNLWETWDCPTHRQWLDESSRSHHYQASINTFLRKHVAGLDMPAGAAAWGAVAVRPYAALPLPSDLERALPHARATLRAHRGVIEVSWARAGASASGALELNVTLPSGSGGSVSVPKAGAVSEGGRAVWAGGAFVPGVPGVLAGVEEEQWLTFAVTSGAFQFQAS